MTVQRFDFQRQCVELTSGLVLNVGANQDPAKLKDTYGARIVNCDRHDYDPHLGGPIEADVYFDASKTWPFESDYAGLVIFGDIMEHLTIEQQVTALMEAYRVAQFVCITVPDDDRFKADPPDPEKNEGWTHLTHVTCVHLHRLLFATGWTTIHEFHTVDYSFVPRGYFVLAER